MYRRRCQIAFQVLLVALMISGCGRGQESGSTPLDKKELAGNWRFTKADEVALQSYEFSDDGTFVMNMRILSRDTHTTGTYQIKGNRITLDYEAKDFETETFEASISSDQLKLRNTKDGKELIFERTGP